MFQIQGVILIEFSFYFFTNPILHEQLSKIKSQSKVTSKVYQK